ncbi:ataxin-3 isoform X2 [Halyomorpha halys]|uniref:ataxin-3 isoform X2 n=1 Tax=Halyomorpha halys TaxID=286706 RepID=UPI0034D33AD8
MDCIFHEKQEGSLCAQHCLNALLQGPYFTPVDLATLAEKMDDEERLRMAESGVDSDDYRRFMQQPSENMDDSGYFSVQVISSALEVWGLELVPFNSSEPICEKAKRNPETMTAYICNYRDHWFTIRKLGYQWFNLNSLLSGPELISDTYLSIFLAQLQQEGSLPDCPADEQLKKFPAVKVSKSLPKKAPVKTQQEFELEKAIKLSLGVPVDKDEEDLQAAIELSLREESQDPSLDHAIKLSLQLDPSRRAGGDPGSSKEKNQKSLGSSNEDDEDLEGAIRLSLEGHDLPPEGKSIHKPRVVNIPIKIEEREDISRAPIVNVPPVFPEERVVSEPKVVNIPIKIEGHEDVQPKAVNNCTPMEGVVDAAEIRRRRLAYIEGKASSSKR